MSSYARVQLTIQDITDDLYPAVDLLFQKINIFRKASENIGRFETALEIFDVLREEIRSLKKYELKLVFPGIKRCFGELNAALPKSLRINELHALLKKKEECIKSKALDLEVEIDENNNNPLGELVIFLKEDYVCKKDTFYTCIAKLQKEQAAKISDEDILEPDSLAI